MSIPLVILCIPGVAFIFFVQMLLCEAYHFRVSVSRQKRNNYNQTMDKSAPSKEDKATLFEKEQTSKGTMKQRLDVHKPDSDPEIIRPTTTYRQNVNADLPNQGELGSDIEISGGDPKVDYLKTRRKSVFAESYDPSLDNDDTTIVNPKTPEEKNWLTNNLHKVMIFKHLEKDQTNTVVDAMFKCSVSKGDVIMKQGDKGNTFFVIQVGNFNVYVKDMDDSQKLVHTYNNKGSFGELALLYNQPRAATIVAQTDGVLWAVDGQTFRRIVYKKTYQKRIMYENLINNVPMLKSLKDFERANLVDALMPMTFEDNEIIIKQGDEAHGMFFIISGRVRIVMETAEKEFILLNELGNSEYFGELALIKDNPRSASVFSIGKTQLAFLDRDAFERLLGPCMEVMQRQIDRYNKRLKEALLRKEDN